MIKLSQEIKVAYFAKFKRYLVNLIGEECTTKLIDTLGGDTEVMDASFGMSLDSGCAYEGALIKNVLDIADYAVKLNEILPGNVRSEKSTIYKIVLLQHISKCIMYIKNDNDWEVEKRGMFYKFNDDGSNRPTLRCGEYSALLALMCGVPFTPQEYSAMTILDNINRGDESVRWYSSPLATIIRQANELVGMINKDIARGNN